MYFGTSHRETVSVIGTPAFMEFVESIQSEGVTFERVPMGGEGGRERQDALVVEVDKEATAKDIEVPDIALPRLTRRFNRELRICRSGVFVVRQPQTAHQAFHAGRDSRDRLQNHARFRGGSNHPDR